MTSDSYAADDKNLRALQTIAVDKALATKEMTDIEKATSIAKTITDREKTAYENQNHSALLRLESYKAFATAVVPLLTLATLAFTVWIQIKQLNETALANADAGWRDTAQKVLSQLRPTGGNVSRQQPPVDVQLALQLLRPYFSDLRHGTEAIDIAMLVVSRVDDANAAKNLFASQDIQVTDSNFGTFLYRIKEVGATLNAVDDTQNSVGVSDSQKEKLRIALGNMLRLVCGKMSDALHASPPATLPLDLHGIHFYDCNFVNVDFGRSAIGNSIFDHVDLRGADLSHVDDFVDSEWTASNWWNARSIGGTLLMYLITTYYPYAEGETSYNQPPPDVAVYKATVQSLCKGAKIECSNAQIVYGPQLTADVKPMFAGLSTNAVVYLATEDLGGNITYYRNPVNAEVKEASSELVAAKLCDEVPHTEIRAYEQQEKVASGTYVYAITCSENYGKMREFLTNALIPEYMIRSSHVVGKAQTDSVVEDAAARVGKVLTTFSPAGIDFVLKHESGENWVGASPKGIEKKGVDEVVSGGLCTVDDADDRRLEETRAGEKANSIVYGISCDSRYVAVRSFVLESLIPQLVKDMKTADKTGSPSL